MLQLYREPSEDVASREYEIEMEEGDEKGEDDSDASHAVRSTGNDLAGVRWSTLLRISSTILEALSEE